MKFSNCHPELRHHAKGLCHTCYVRQYHPTDIKARTKEDPDYFRKASQKWRESNPEQRMLSSAKSGAKRRGIPFSLEVEDIRIPELCPILGIPLIKAIGKVDNNSPSIDRIDNTRGYTKDNIVIISYRANRLKSDSTLDELTKLVEFYREQSRN